MKVSCLSFLFVAVDVFHTIRCYPYGPPKTTFVCKDMFPIGHGKDAQFTEPPYTIKLSQNVYTPWEELRISVTAQTGHYIRGLFVQARRANCNHPQQKEPVGTFMLLPGERYLQTMSCLDRLNSSLSHRSNPGLKTAVFRWFAPAVRAGHLYFVATIVKEKSTFWTTVHSEILRDLSLTAEAAICPARQLLDPKMPQTTTESSPTPLPYDKSSATDPAPLRSVFLMCLCTIVVYMNNEICH